MYAPLFVAGYVAWVWFCALFTSANPSPFVGVIVAGQRPVVQEGVGQSASVGTP